MQPLLTDYQTNSMTTAMIKSSCKEALKDSARTPLATLLRRSLCTLAIVLLPLTASADDAPGPICISLERRTAVNQDSQFPAYPFVRPITFQSRTDRERINVLLKSLPCEQFCKGVISIVDPKMTTNIEAEFVNNAFFDVNYGRDDTSEFFENNKKLKITRIGYFKRSDGKYIYIRNIMILDHNNTKGKSQEKLTFYRTDYQIIDSIQHSGASSCLSRK